MPIGIVTSEAEIDLVNDIWPVPAPGMPKVRKGIVEFAPQLSRQIVNEIQQFTTEDEDVATRLINRIVDIVGPEFLPGDNNPVENEEELTDIEDEDDGFQRHDGE